MHSNISSPCVHLGYFKVGVETLRQNIGLGETSGPLEDFTKKLCLDSPQEKDIIGQRELIIGFNDISMPFQ